MIEVFVPCKAFETSREFYQAIGFKVEPPIEGDSLTSYATYQDQGGIILQDYYVKDWAENTMMTLTVDDLNAFIKKVQMYKQDHEDTPVKYRAPEDYGWGLQIHLLDPSGVLWHVFQKK